MAPQPPQPHPPKIKTLWQASANAYWPRPTHYATYPLILCIAAGFAQFGLGIYLVGKIHAPDNTVRCLSFAGQEEWVEMVRPVVVVDEGTFETWGFGGRVGLGLQVWLTIAFPAITIVWPSLLCMWHTRPRPLSPRIALPNAICLLFDWLCYVFADGPLYVDVDARYKKWPLCYVPHERAEVMGKARGERLRGLAVREWIGVVGTLFASVYLSFVLCAAWLVYKEASRAAVRAAADLRVASLQNGAASSADERSRRGTPLRDLPSVPAPSAGVYPPSQPPRPRLQSRPEVYVPTNSPVDAQSGGKGEVVGSAGAKAATTNTTTRLQPVVEDEERDVGVRDFGMRGEGGENPFEDPKDGSEDAVNGNPWQDTEAASKSRIQDGGSK